MDSLEQARSQFLRCYLPHRHCPNLSRSCLKSVLFAPSKGKQYGRANLKAFLVVVLTELMALLNDFYSDLSLSGDSFCSAVDLQLWTEFIVVQGMNGDISMYRQSTVLSKERRS